MPEDNTESVLFDLVKSDKFIGKTGDTKVKPINYLSSSFDDDDGINFVKEVKLVVNEVVKTGNLEKKLVVDELDGSVTQSPVSVEEKESVQKSIRAFDAFVGNKKMLHRMKKCRVRLPKRDTGDLLHSIKNSSICKSNRNNDSKTFKKREGKPVASPKDDIFKTPTLLPLHESPRLRRLSRTNLRCLTDSPIKRLGKRPQKKLVKRPKKKLVKQFGLRFFKSYVRILKTKTTTSVLKTPSKNNRLKCNNLNKSVSFCDTVELLGEVSFSPLKMDEDDILNKEIFKQPIEIVSPRIKCFDNDDIGDCIKSSDSLQDASTVLSASEMLDDVTKEMTVSTANDKLEENTVSTANDKVEENTVSTANDQLEENTVSTAADKLEENVISKANDKQEENTVFTASDNLEENVVCTPPNHSLKKNKISTVAENFEENTSSRPSDKLEQSIISSETEEVDGIMAENVNELKTDDILDKTKKHIDDDSKNQDEKMITSENNILNDQNEMIVDDTDSIIGNDSNKCIDKILDLKDDLKCKEVETYNENGVDMDAEKILKETKEEKQKVEEETQSIRSYIDNELLEEESVKVSKINAKFPNVVDETSKDDFLYEMEIDDESDEVPKDSLRYTEEESEEDKMSTDFLEKNDTLRIQESETDDSNESIADNSALDSISYATSKPNANGEISKEKNAIDSNSVDKPKRDFDSSDDDISAVLDSIDPPFINMTTE